MATVFAATESPSALSTQPKETSACLPAGTGGKLHGFCRIPFRGLEIVLAPGDIAQWRERHEHKAPRSPSSRRRGTASSTWRGLRPSIRLPAGSRCQVSPAARHVPPLAMLVAHRKGFDRVAPHRVQVAECNVDLARPNRARSGTRSSHRPGPASTPRPHGQRLHGVHRKIEAKPAALWTSASRVGGTAPRSPSSILAVQRAASPAQPRRYQNSRRARGSPQGHIA